MSRVDDRGSTLEPEGKWDCDGNEEGNHPKEDTEIMEEMNYDSWAFGVLNELANQDAREGECDCETEKAKC
ncbi:hypothetical protein DVH24_038038 [Malus domestica]|uniref:Uncharacterized protein n=1 Tax=Malus domestica TaxID=3750 RepID=A0A498KBL7_MALDO|nr:hypothetical protein DVH24_038038 [Malus domestica]